MNTKVYKEINVDFSDMKYLLIRAKQNDNGSRFLLINCYNSGNRVLLNGQNHKAFIRYVKPDGYGVFNMGKITSDGSIEVELTEQMLSVAGNSVADVVLIDNSGDSPIGLTVNEEGQLVLPSDSKIISTMNFAIEVIQSPLDSSEIESTYEFNALNDLLKRANLDYSNIIQTIRGYRDEAKVSEINSKQSEIKTKESETNAKSSENKARESETNSKLSEGNARESELRSKESETKAKESENISTSKAEEATNVMEVIEGYKNESSSNKALTKEYLDKAQSYAVGGTDTRDGEDTDNSKYYYEQSKALKEITDTNASTTSVHLSEIREKHAQIEAWQDEVSSSKDLVIQSKNNVETYKNEAKQSKAEAKESEERAKQSEISAKASEDNIARAELDATLNAKKAQSYAIGGTDFRPDENVKNAQYYYEQARQISEGLGGALLPIGTIPFSELQNQTKSKGYMYNISDDFVSDDTFKDGGGISYPSGTNVYYTTDNKWDCLAGTNVVGVKGNNEGTFRKGNVNITAENIGTYDKETLDSKFSAIDGQIEEKIAPRFEGVNQKTEELRDNLSQSTNDLNTRINSLSNENSDKFSNVNNHIEDITRSEFLKYYNLINKTTLISGDNITITEGDVSLSVNITESENNDIITTTVTKGNERYIKTVIITDDSVTGNITIKETYLKEVL